VYLLYLKKKQDADVFVGALDGEYDDGMAAKLLKSLAPERADSPADKQRGPAAACPVAVQPDGGLRCTFVATDLAGVYLTRYARSQPVAVPPALWPAFAEAVGTARLLPRDVSLEVSQEEAVLTILNDGRQVYLEGAGAHRAGAEGVAGRPMLECEALGQAVDAARAAGKATKARQKCRLTWPKSSPPSHTCPKPSRRASWPWSGLHLQDEQPHSSVPP